MAITYAVILMPATVLLASVNWNHIDTYHKSLVGAQSSAVVRCADFLSTSDFLLPFPLSNVILTHTYSITVYTSLLSSSAPNDCLRLTFSLFADIVRDVFIIIAIFCFNLGPPAQSL